MSRKADPAERIYCYNIYELTFTFLSAEQVAIYLSSAENAQHSTSSSCASICSRFSPVSLLKSWQRRENRSLVQLPCQLAACLTRHLITLALALHITPHVGVWQELRFQGYVYPPNQLADQIIHEYHHLSHQMNIY